MECINTDGHFFQGLRLFVHATNMYRASTTYEAVFFVLERKQ